MSHRKFEHPRHGSLGFLPRKRAARHRGKGTFGFFYYLICALKATGVRFVSFMKVSHLDLIFQDLSDSCHGWVVQFSTEEWGKMLYAANYRNAAKLLLVLVMLKFFVIYIILGTRQFIKVNFCFRVAHFSIVQLFMISIGKDYLISSVLL